MPQIPQIKRHFNVGDVIYNVGDKAASVYLIHSGQVSIISTHGLEIGTLADGEMFGEVGRVIGSPRTVNAKAKTRCIIHEIDWEIVQNNLAAADPILVAIIRGLALRIGDANDLTEKYWRELSIYKSLEDIEKK